MNRQEVFDWCRQRYGTKPDYPWKDWNAVLRHVDNNKWYGVIIEVDCSKLAMNRDSVVDVLNVIRPLLVCSECRLDSFWHTMLLCTALIGLSAITDSMILTDSMCMWLYANPFLHPGRYLFCPQDFLPEWLHYRHQPLWQYRRDWHRYRRKRNLV